MKKGASWRKIKAEYIAGGISQRALADKYGVSFGAVSKRARKEHWNATRKAADEKAAEKVAQKTAEIVADNAALCEQIKTKLLQKLNEMVDRYPSTGAVEVKTRTEDAEYVFRMKDIAAVYSALTDKATTRGQSADIEDLAPLSDLLKE